MKAYLSWPFTPFLGGIAWEPLFHQERLASNDDSVSFRLTGGKGIGVS